MGDVEDTIEQCATDIAAVTSLVVNCMPVLGDFKGATVKGKSGVKWGPCPDLLCVGCSGPLVVVLLSLPGVGYRQSMGVAMVPRCASL